MKNDIRQAIGGMGRVAIALIIAMSALTLTGGQQAGAATINVPAQYTNIQDAINHASVGDIIVLADGTYSGVKNYNVDFGGKAVTVQSANGPTNCIIDCKQLGRAFIAQSQEKPTTQVIGLTIKNGSASDGAGIYTNANLVVKNCVFTNNVAVSGNSGGGMYGGTAISCSFTNNTAGNGGGMSNGIASNCAFTSNTSTYNGGGGYAITATNCVFTNNMTSGDGGGLYSSYLAETNCIFTGNTASGHGGGMSSGYAYNCVFTNNSTTGQSNSYGGGMSVGRAQNCVFFQNSAHGSGGGTYSTSLLNCTVVNNTALGDYGGGIYNGSYVYNCIVWGNSASTVGLNIYADGGNITVKYSDVEQGFIGTGNINADPLFVNQAGGDLHLTAGSPCIDTGTTNINPPYDWSLTTNDLDGGRRIAGAGPDMGAYEYGGARKFVWQNQVSGDVAYWTMKGTQAGAKGYLSQGVGTVWQIVAYADVTGNGYPAMIWQNSVSGDVYYWQTTPSGPTATRGYLAQGVGPDWRIAAVADITGDGKPDLIWQNKISGNVVYWQMNGTTFASSGILSTGIPPDWKVVAAADVVGDGTNDLIWQNQISGDVLYWKMYVSGGIPYHDTSNGGSGYLAQGVTPVWRLVGVSQITGDTNPYLIWQNKASGDVYYWQMGGIGGISGYSQIGGGYLSQGLSSSWKIVGFN